MDANDRRVDHSNVPVVGFCDHVHQAVPHAGLPPAIEAIVDGRWRPITLRQVGPPSSRPQYPKNAVQYPAIIDPRHTARLIRQTRLDRLPLGIRQLIAAHRKPPVWELESRLARAGNPRTRFMSLRPKSTAEWTETIGPLGDSLASRARNPRYYRRRFSSWSRVVPKKIDDSLA